MLRFEINLCPHTKIFGEGFNVDFEKTYGEK